MRRSDAGRREPLELLAAIGASAPAPSMPIYYTLGTQKRYRSARSSGSGHTRRLRPEGAKLLAAVRPGEAVVAAKMDRMFRSAADALRVSEDFKCRRISLWLLDLGNDCSENGISDDPGGRRAIRTFADQRQNPGREGQSTAQRQSPKAARGRSAGSWVTSTATARRANSSPTQLSSAPSQRCGGRLDLVAPDVPTVARLAGEHPAAHRLVGW